MEGAAFQPRGSWGGNCAHKYHMFPEGECDFISLGISLPFQLLLCWMDANERKRVVSGSKGLTGVEGLSRVLVVAMDVWTG